MLFLTVVRRSTFSAAMWNSELVAQCFVYHITVGRARMPVGRIKHADINNGTSFNKIITVIKVHVFVIASWKIALYTTTFIKLLSTTLLLSQFAFLNDLPSCFAMGAGATSAHCEASLDWSPGCGTLPAGTAVVPDRNAPICGACSRHARTATGWLWLAAGGAGRSWKFGGYEGWWL